MKIADLADTPPTPTTKGPDCHLGALTSAADEDDIAVLQHWLEAPPHKVPAQWIADQLVALGHHISADTIRRHRSGRCEACRRRGRTWAIGRVDG